MSGQKIVFVIGAGASAELRFPVGSQLVSQISSDLTLYKAPQPGPTVYRYSDDELNDALKSNPDLQKAAEEIASHAPNANSIDDFVHQRRGDPAVSKCAKLAIVNRIAKAEALSSLMRNKGSSPKGIKENYLSSMLKILVRQQTFEELQESLANVTLIIFNYDRSVEYFLDRVLKKSYGSSVGDLSGPLSRIPKIIHPYGCIPNEFSYGTSLVGDSLIQAAEGIRTYTEAVDDTQREITRELEDSHTVVFLGVAFHRQMLMLLSGIGADSPARLYGTSYGLSDPDRQDVKSNLQSRYGSITLDSSQCLPFLQAYERTLQAAIVRNLMPQS